jgi:hypothetical protein
LGVILGLTVTSRFFARQVLMPINATDAKQGSDAFQHHGASVVLTLVHRALTTGYVVSLDYQIGISIVLGHLQKPQ